MKLQQALLLYTLILHMTYSHMQQLVNTYVAQKHTQGIAIAITSTREYQSLGIGHTHLPISSRAVYTVQLDLNLSKNRVWCCTHTQYVQFQPRLALRVHAKLLTRILLAGTSRVSTRVPDVPSRACIIKYLKRMQHKSTCARELSL